MTTTLLSQPPSPTLPEVELPLVGSLRHLSVVDLLQTAETARRSGRIALRHGEREGTLWLSDGRVVHASDSDGREGRDAALDLVLWEDGRFAADFVSGEPVAATIDQSVSHLLLEAAQRLDEAHRFASPPHASLPDPPPPPPRPLIAVHRALTLLGVASAYAAHHATPAILAGRLEQSRRKLAPTAGALDRFTVSPAGQAAIREDAAELGEDEVAGFVRDVSAWLLEFFAGMEHALPGRFPRQRLRQLTEAVRDDLEELGFLRELGLDSATEPR